MEYQLKHKSKLQNREWLRQIAKEQGKSFPVLDNEPEMLSVALPFWECFHNLSKRRPVPTGFIPYSEISAYFELNGITGLERKSMYIDIITSLDEIFVADTRKQKPLQTGKGGRGRKSR